MPICNQHEYLYLMMIFLKFLKDKSKFNLDFKIPQRVQQTFEHGNAQESHKTCIGTLQESVHLKREIGENLAF
jgi:hypothetical protein